ncbi:MAG TPA: Rieske 2Fe-2S domain-containing protein, partial [Thermomicrobiales bacterium]
MPGTARPASARRIIVGLGSFNLRDARDASTMDVTYLGHAGLFIETRFGSILCDPWFNPAYFASWFPFPSNEGVDLAAISRPTYLYLSHLHQDHFDPTFLRDHVSKEATVLLPDYPLDLLERALRALGFTRFVRTANGQPLDLDGLRVAISALAAPLDGAMGDSALVVDDGTARIFDQNDAKPRDLRTLNPLGPFDAHFLLHAGGSWYPMVYELPETAKRALGRKKRENGLARAHRYAEQVGASFVVPSAGPPCLLDDDLFAENDFDGDETNTHPDQTVFIDYLRAHGKDNGRLLIPGSVATIERGRFAVRHPLPAGDVSAIFADKRSYLAAYKARKQPVIDAHKASWPRGRVEILPALRDWFEPLLDQADRICRGVDGRVILDFGDSGVVVDFRRRRVVPWHGETGEYRITVDPALVESCILRRAEDWANEIFLSYRFRASREGHYNEFLQCFFQSLSAERIQFAEGFYADQAAGQDYWFSHGYRIQRRCPHLRADLSRFGSIDNGVLTCALHGWQFDLA